MIRNTFFILFLFVALTTVYAQDYNSSSIFAHNDYATSLPFYTAWKYEVGYVEADVFLQKHSLKVAHEENAVDKAFTLEQLYLIPLEQKIKENKGSVYKNADKHLTLMIDLKTEGAATLALLVKKLKAYPTLINCTTLHFMISGNEPAPSEWSNYPDFITFDGRPGVAYTEAQLRRVPLISTSMSNFTSWNGKGVLTAEDKAKLQAVIAEVHNKNKKIRFWGSPDHVNAWVELMKLHIDLLNTDHVPELAAFVNHLKTTTYQNDSAHAIYKPKYAFDESKTPKNVILLIGDGMGLAQIYSGYTANHGQLNLFGIQNIGLSITSSFDSYITDSAAGATAMATGNKTNNRAIGVDSAAREVPSVAEILKTHQFNNALITSGDVTDATPAGFYGHVADRGMQDQIAKDFLSGNVDILMGAGIKKFNQDDIQMLEQNKYHIYESIDNINQLPTEKCLVFDSNASKSIADGRGDFLSSAFEKAGNVLTQDGKPFFMMLEGAQIDWGGHGKNFPYVVSEMLDFDIVVGQALQFVDEHPETLLIVTADHETGGISLIDGNVAKGYVHGHFSTNDHTAIPVPVFAYGPGSSCFKGVYQNTAIFDRILEALQIKNYLH